MSWWYAFLGMTAYLVGSIPSGYLLCKFWFGIDITSAGSGNIGATNVARVLGDVRYFFVIFAFDFLKSALFLFSFKGHMPLLLSAMLLLGNAFSFFLNFRGGKGVATFFGIVFALFPLYISLCLSCSFLVLLAVARRVDIASLCAGVATSMVALMSLLLHQALFLSACVLFLFYTHRENIKKIWGII